MKMYKVEKGSELFTKLMALMDRMTAAAKAANKLVKQLGYETYANSSQERYIAGGIGAIEITGGKPEGWVRMGKSWQNLYMPNSKNKALWDQINALPKIKESELTAILPYPPMQLLSPDTGSGMIVSSMPHVYFDRRFVLIQILTGAKFTEVPGMIEITGTEFERLMKIHEGKPAKKQKA